MKKKRLLPKYVSGFKDRHGKTRLYFWRNGCKKHYFKTDLGTADFLAEYHHCLNPGETPAPVVERAPKAERPTRAGPGTVNELFELFTASPTRLGPSEVTQRKVYAVLDYFRQSYGEFRVAKLRFNHIDEIIEQKREQRIVVRNGRDYKVGGIHAARKLRKELQRMFEFACKLEMIATNPVRLSAPVATTVEERSDGFHCWTEDEIEQFRARHLLGTRERLAMELYLWTDQRRSDVCRMGRSQIKDGFLPVVQAKTGKEIFLPVAPQLLEAIDAMAPGDTSPFCFLVTHKGMPFARESMGNFFKRACVAAGLPHCTAHGLRKAMLRRMAELEMSYQSMKSVSGQTRDDTVSDYIKKANQRKLASGAIGAVSDWERGKIA